jgi:predicted nucleotidyltransferase
MLSAIDREIAVRFKQQVQSVAPLLALWVYGSRARGDASAESDLDLFIELEKVTPALRRQISEIAWQVGFEQDRVISTLVATREQLQHGPLGADPLLDHVRREGVRI